MRLLCSMGQRDNAVSYTIVSNKNYTHWYRIIVYSQGGGGGGGGAVRTWYN